MLLSGCGQNIIEPIYIKPPQALLSPCPNIEFTGKTYGDLVVYIRHLQSHYSVCKRQVDGTKEWAENLNKK